MSKYSGYPGNRQNKLASQWGEIQCSDLYGKDQMSFRGRSADEDEPFLSLQIMPYSGSGTCQLHDVPRAFIAQMIPWLTNVAQLNSAEMPRVLAPQTVTPSQPPRLSADDVWQPYTDTRALFARAHEAHLFLERMEGRIAVNTTPTGNRVAEITMNGTVVATVRDFGLVVLWTAQLDDEKKDGSAAAFDLGVVGALEWIQKRTKDGIERVGKRLE